MASDSILLRPSFWYAFIGLVIVVLFIYGMRITEDRTDLTKAKIELEQRNEELTSCMNDVERQSIKIDELTNTISHYKNTISEQSVIIGQKNKTISEQQTRIVELENRPPKIVTKYQDRVVYKEKPEPYHPYGKGYGKLTIYSQCSTCTGIQVTVDGEYWGVLNYYFSGQPNCGQDGTISKIVTVGKHHIKGKDKHNYTWDYYTTIKEDKCNFWHYGN